MHIKIGNLLSIQNYFINQIKNRYKLEVAQMTWRFQMIYRING